MIKVDVRQNGTFVTGFPYNNKVDDYFYSLSDYFISNYGLTQNVVLKVNDHKNKTQVFDAELHAFVFTLSEFIINFEKSCQPLIVEFERLNRNIVPMCTERDELITKQNKFNEVYGFAQTNIEKLRVDITKVTELLQYYSNKLVVDKIEYTDSYITDTQARIAIIISILTQTAFNFDYYKEAVVTQATAIAVVSEQVIERSFYERTLRVMYEEWQKRPEQYFVNLVEYFKPEYESVWTYGESLMFGEKEDEENAAITLFQTIAKKWQEALFEGYKFRLEQELKEYSITWLRARGESEFDDTLFQFSMANKQLALLTEDIQEVLGIITEKEQALRSLFSYSKEQNFYKYKELVISKISYIVENYSTGLDQGVLDDFDLKLQSAKPDYEIVYKRLAKRTYWEFKADLFMYNELLSELQSQQASTKIFVDRGYTPQQQNENAEITAKINYYTAEKINLEDKVQQLVKMQRDSELENAVVDFRLKTVLSYIEENDKEINKQVLLYKALFDSRVQFFTSKSPDTNTGMINLLKGKVDVIEEYVTFFRMFLEYKTDVIWYDEDDRALLKQLYSTIIEMLRHRILHQWHREFMHDILNPTKYHVYKYYLDAEMKSMFGIAHMHFNGKKYKESFIGILEERIIEIKRIFEIYARISFGLKKNMYVLVDIFNYEKSFEFDIETNEETFQNVMDTFDDIIGNILAYAFAKNMEFKMNEDRVKRLARINQVWLDMEKINV